MGCLQELQAAVFDERDVAPSELQLQRSRVMRRAEQDGLPRKLGPRFAMLKDTVDHERRLLRLVLAGDKGRLRAALPIREEVLVVTLLGTPDDPVRGVKQRLCGPVVLGESEYGGAREARGEVQDVAHGRCPKAVDRLRVIAHGRDSRSVGPEQRDDIGLQGVRVLVLVHKHRIEALAHACAALRVGEQSAPKTRRSS